MVLRLCVTVGPSAGAKIPTQWSKESPKRLVEANCEEQGKVSASLTDPVVWSIGGECVDQILL